MNTKYIRNRNNFHVSWDKKIIFIIFLLKFSDNLVVIIFIIFNFNKYTVSYFISHISVANLYVKNVISIEQKLITKTNLKIITFKLHENV